MGVTSEPPALVAPQARPGPLIIASSHSFGDKWLQPRLPDFLRAHPETRVRLSTMTAHADLESNRFDIAITYGLPATGHRHVEPLLVERLRPLCSPALAATIGLDTPRDLARATLIHSINALSWTEYLRQVGAGEVRPNNELWLDRPTMAIEAAVDRPGARPQKTIPSAQEPARARPVPPSRHT